MGYQNVQVLDGGLSAYEKALADNPKSSGGYVIDTSAPKAPTPIKIDDNFIKRDDSRYFAFEQINVNTRKNIVDSRSKERFESQDEGHIPESKNLPGTDLVTEEGYLIGKHAYKHILKTKGISEDQPVVGSCGSGTTASVNAFLHELHTEKKMKVYDGSISEFLVKADPKDIEKGKVPAAKTMYQ
jgi:thiosulfate/3-mercaptopyruvate sulfurtransferase